MKRFLALLLCLALAVSLVALVACDGDDSATTTTTTTENSDNTDNSGNTDNPGSTDKTPEQIYNEALAKVAGLTNYRLVTEQVISSQGFVINQTVISMQDGKNVYVKTTNSEDAAYDIEAWYVGEVYYCKTSEISFKANIPYETFVAEYMAAGSTSEGALMNIPAEWFKDTQFVQSEDTYYIEFVVSGEQYKEYMNNSSLGAMVDGIDDICYRVYFTKDGELDNIVTEFQMETDGTVVDVVSTTLISDVGSTTVTAPVNGDSFVDMTDSLS